MKTSEEIELIESLSLNKRLSFAVHYIIESQLGIDPVGDLVKASAWLERELKHVQAEDYRAAQAQKNAGLKPGQDVILP